jgi:hypothetical protein
MKEVVEVGHCVREVAKTSWHCVGEVPEFDGIA